MTFGTAISTYNRKSNPALSKYKKTTAQLLPYEVTLAPQYRDSINQGITDYRKQIGYNSPTAPAKGGGWNPNQNTALKTALSGGGNAVASGFLTAPIQEKHPFLLQSGISSKRGIGPQYNRLNRINETTDILNQGSQNQLDLRNAQISRRNAMLRSQPSIGDFGNYDGGMYDAGNGADFFGIGGGDSGLDDEQIANARLIANVGRQRGFDDRGIQIALMTALTESGLRNLNYGDRDSLGLYQQRHTMGWGTPQQIMNPTYSAGKFYDTLKGVNWRGLSPWAAAQAVQRSFDPTGNNYRVQWDLANRAFRSLSTNPGARGYAGAKANSAAGFIQQYNNRYIDYDGAFGAQCVDLYNVYTARFVGGKNIMVGYAPEIFNAYDTRAYTRLGGNTRGVMGDVAIFNRGPGTPYGHVAIVVGDNGNGTLRVLHSNAGPMGSRGNSMISNISKSTLMGYLRPNRRM